jgi:NADPH:quinone reductase-like Zn-dependent oxidoreductase
MRAICIHEYGPPDVLVYGTLPVPEPAADEVLVRVCAAGVNPIDWKVRNGSEQQRFAHELPLTLGWDCSGMVVQNGTSVTEFRIGDEVYGHPDPARNGTYAEYVAVRVNEIVAKPRRIDHLHAAAVPMAALTAWQALFGSDAKHPNIDLTEGQRVLIHGAAGGVGSFAIQFAKWRGASVIASTLPEYESFTLALGADQVVAATNLGALQMNGVDAVLDLVGGPTQLALADCVVDGGVLASTAGIEPLASLDPASPRKVEVATAARPLHLSAIATLIDEGIITVPVSRIFPLAEARRAHELSENGRVHGKFVLSIWDGG